MAQDFSLRYPLVDGRGNFGSLDGDGAAAMRYTECKLQKIAAELLDELKKSTVHWRPNYDGTKSEPVMLPARLPEPARQRRPRASPSAWPRPSRRTTSARCSRPAWRSSRIPRSSRRTC